MLSLDSSGSIITSDRIGGVIRAIGATLGGYLVNSGYISASTAELATGLAVSVVVAIWSWWTNRPEKIINVRS